MKPYSTDRCVPIVQETNKDYPCFFTHHTR